MTVQTPITARWIRPEAAERESIETRALVIHAA
jgi:hypothetical protein